MRGREEEKKKSLAKTPNEGRERKERETEEESAVNVRQITVRVRHWSYKLHSSREYLISRFLQPLVSVLSLEEAVREAPTALHMSNAIISIVSIASERYFIRKISI